ncbi:MAG: aldo/keto reductase, partial [Planctomycetota bacterium]
MRTRRLGNTDLELTVIGLGTWAIGGSWQFGWGPQDDADSIRTILAAMDGGINWIDTAPIYGCGH